MGDFNRRGIECSTFTANSEGQALLDLFQDLFLTQHVYVPTRGDSIMDLVFSSEPGMVEDVNVMERFGNSDHNIVTFGHTVQVNLTILINKFRDFRKAAYDGMRRYLQSIDWNKLFDGMNTVDMWNHFKIILNKAMDDFVPWSQGKEVNSQFGWITRLFKHAEKVQEMETIQNVTKQRQQSQNIRTLLMKLQQN
ncbi:hypothetical protein BSL78_21808 [Apostichopus japonicus]|uniref:Uncharacterized protein n=1 Tax=Stichopus japonicus TaxID=307972 RepID=A0A2G8K009_STIJA|nr:hypothetical protein BSL78_21808 [Apostichopus japonicus]